MRYVIDSRYFDGECITSMTDDVHSDYGEHETVEEMRERMNNPFLETISPERMMFLLERYGRSLTLPFTPITETCYFEYMNSLPPRRAGRNFFFVGEPTWGAFYTLCFRTEDGRCFKGERSIMLTDEDVYRQIEEHEAIINFHPQLLKSEPYDRFSAYTNTLNEMIPYYFEKGGRKFFIANLRANTGNKYEEEMNRFHMARALWSLRKNHCTYLAFTYPQQDLWAFIDWVRKNHYTLETYGQLLYFDPEREFADFQGNLVEYSHSFHFRIYSREVLSCLIAQLRTIKR